NRIQLFGKMHNLQTEMSRSLTIDQDLKRKLAVAKLESLILSICVDQLYIWTGVMNLQHSLKNLQITIIDGTKDTLPPPPEVFFFDHLEHTLFQNGSRLTSIQLEKFQLSRQLDARIFGGMTGLKRLIL